MKNNYKKTYFLFLAIIGLAFYILNTLSPVFLDDYFYKYVFVGDHVDFNRPINNIKDIIVSQYIHYFSFNGRTVVHSFVQLFIGIIGKNVFNAINTFVFCGLIVMLAKYTFGQIKSIHILIITLLLGLMPGFNDTFLWLTGSINYMWTAAATLMFLLLLKRTEDEEISYKHI